MRAHAPDGRSAGGRFIHFVFGKKMIGAKDYGYGFSPDIDPSA